MIRLIVGNKGTGKTKKLINLANEAVLTTKGNVVFIEKGLDLTYDVSHKARLIDIENYSISGFDSFYGFIAGLLAGNYDITDMFFDATLKIGGRDLEQFASMVDKLAPLAGEDTALTFAVSCDPFELPERVAKYII